MEKLVLHKFPPAQKMKRKRPLQENVVIQHGLLKRSHPIVYRGRGESTTRERKGAPV